MAEESCACDAQPWLEPSASCTKDIPKNASKDAKLYLSIYDDKSDLAYICNCNNTEVCNSAVDFAFNFNEETLDSSCGKHVSVTKDGGTLDVTLLEPPCVDDEGNANITKQMIDAIDNNQTVCFVEAWPAGNKLSGFGTINARGNATIDYTSSNPQPFPFTIRVTDGNYRELACGEVFPNIVAIRPIAMQGGAGAPFAPAEIKILSGSTDLMAAASAAELTAGTSGVSLFVSQNAGSKTNLVDGDLSSTWDGGLATTEPYAGAELCRAVPLITCVELCPSNAGGGANNMPTAFDLIVTGDGGLTWEILQSFSGYTWTDGECQTITVSDPRESAVSPIAGNTNTELVYSNVETVAAAGVEQSIDTTLFNHAIIVNQSTDTVWVSFGSDVACSGTARIQLDPYGGIGTNAIDHHVPESSKLNLCTDGTNSQVKVTLFRD